YPNSRGTAWRRAASRQSGRDRRVPLYAVAGEPSCNRRAVEQGAVSRPIGTGQPQPLTYSRSAEIGLIMDGEEQVFWGRVSKGPGPREEKATAARDKVVTIVSSELGPGERVMVVLQHVPIWGPSRAIAVTWERVFIIEWGRRRPHEITHVADRADVSA